MGAGWFRIALAEPTFRRYAAAEGVELAALHAPAALALVLGFYRGRRAQHASVPNEGDGLLWQWGPDADAEHFTAAFTRQLVREDAEPITQLTLALAYRWTPSRRTAGYGHTWCFSPAESREFEHTVRSSTGYRAIAQAGPVSVTLRTELL